MEWQQRLLLFSLPPLLLGIQWLREGRQQGLRGAPACPARRTETAPGGGKKNESDGDELTYGRKKKRKEKQKKIFHTVEQQHHHHSRHLGNGESNKAARERRADGGHSEGCGALGSPSDVHGRSRRPLAR